MNFTCGYCGREVSSEKGYELVQPGEQRTVRRVASICICPSCRAPTYFPPRVKSQVPGPLVGREVLHVPADLKTIFNEARSCVANANFTACVLICRKILMHIGVEKGATAGLSFVQYVDHLANTGYVPPNGRHWVDHIPKKSNEANHQIVLMGESDATELLTFIEMLLRFIYEFPSLIPAPPVKSTAP